MHPARYLPPDKGRSEALPSVPDPQIHYGSKWFLIGPGTRWYPEPVLMKIYDTFLRDKTESHLRLNQRRTFYEKSPYLYP